MKIRLQSIITAALLGSILIPLRSYGLTPHCELLPAMQKEIEQIKGSPFKHPVECKVSDRAEIRRYIEEIIKEDFPDERLKNEEMLYRILGLIPARYDYYQGILALYESQLGGFYDPKKKRFTMADWVPPALQRGFVKHELTHAFQDQNYDLSSLVDVTMLTSDEVAARMALLEGDASFTSQLEPANPQSFRRKKNSKISFEIGLPYGVGIPALLQNFLLFPYTAGEQFVIQLASLEGGDSLKEAFIKLPRSTEEILHPEKYHAEQRDFYLPSDEVSGGESQTATLFRDTLGELGVRIFVFQMGGTPSEIDNIGAGWGGDRVRLIRKGREIIGEWRIWFDTEKDQQEFSRFLSSEKFTSQRFLRSNSEVMEKISGGTKIWNGVRIQRSLADVALVTPLGERSR